MTLVAICKALVIVFITFGCYVQGFRVIAMALVAMCKGFKVTAILWMLFGSYLQGFSMIAIALVAICKGFK